MTNKQFKVTIYNNDRLIIQNNYNHFKNAKVKNRVLPTKIRNKDNPYIPTSKYLKTLKENKIRLYNLDIIPNKSVYLTLTTSEILSWIELKSKFQSFLLCVKRTFGKIFYIRTFESHEKDTHFHIHLILMFKDEIPKKFTKKWVKEHWKQGFIDFQKAIEPYGLIDYFTQPKNENINPQNRDFTKLPQFVQIISHSKDFPIANKQEIVATEQGVCDLLNKANENSLQETGQDLYCFSDKHKFIDYNTGEIITRIDKQYFHKPNSQN